VSARLGALAFAAVATLAFVGRDGPAPELREFRGAYSVGARPNGVVRDFALTATSSSTPSPG
jgi:hypothetical protein